MNHELLKNLTILQSALNEYITPDWKNKRSELDFMIASHMEMSELIDTEIVVGGQKHSMGWKWWKGANGGRTMDVVNWDDLHPSVVDNIKIELTDLVFFTLSQKILEDFTNQDEEAEMHCCNDWINFMKITLNNLMQKPGCAMQIIIHLAEKLKFNVCAYYIAKHTLNYIRQLQGYQDGSYKKIVDGKEDNELLHDVIEGITIEAMENDFNGISNKIMNGVYDVFSVDNEYRKTVGDWKQLVV